MWEQSGSALEVTDDNTIGRVYIACWIPKGTDTHSEYVIRTAFPHFSDYVYAYVACVVEFKAEGTQETLRNQRCKVEH
jgi:hypothetical protein